MKKYTLPTLLFILGLVLGIGGNKYLSRHENTSQRQLMEEEPTGMNTFYDEFFNDDFFRENHFPFKMMEKMKKDMNKLLQKHNEEFSSNKVFDDWYGNKFGGKVGEVKQEEDKEFIYYKVHLPNVNQENVKVEVYDGMVNISAQSEEVKKEEDGGHLAQSSLVQRVERRLPVPPNASEERVEFKFVGDDLVIQFPKLNT